MRPAGGAHSGTWRAMTLVADDGASPSPRPTCAPGAHPLGQTGYHRPPAAPEATLCSWPKQLCWADTAVCPSKRSTRGQLHELQQQSISPSSAHVRHRRCWGARTMTRDAQSASRPACAQGGATSVPSDHSATPAISTRAPPILSQPVSFSPAPYCDARQQHAHTPIPQTNLDKPQFAGTQMCRSMCQNPAREVRTSLIPSQQGFAWQNTCAAFSFDLSIDSFYLPLLTCYQLLRTRNRMSMRRSARHTPRRMPKTPGRGQ